ncbi:MAG: hypothetical protein KDB50_13380 [Mycobacterium sp.]|nr:hypothetical protein [Mycobacterium sp.]
MSYFADPDEVRVANLYRFAVGLVDQGEVTDATPRDDLTFTKRRGAIRFGTLPVPISMDTRAPWRPSSDRGA